MTKVLRGLACGVLMLGGCVSAYDPSSPSEHGLGTHAETVGTEEPRPAPKRFTRWRRTPEEVVAQPSPTAGAPQTPVVRPTLTEPGVPIPATPVGNQLAWWIAVLRGADTKNIETHFNAEFLKAVPAPEVRQVARQWRTDELASGPVELVRIEDGATPARLTALIRGTVTERYTQIKLAVDDTGKIAGLWLGPVVGVKLGEITDWAKLDAKLGQLPGQTDLAIFEITPGGLREVHTYHPDADLALGSSFKLYILGTLAEQIAAGKVKWDQPLVIKDDLKSLPSGRMQLETEGAEFPISQYADLMISISDNTAADHLLAFVGRENVEVYMSRLNSTPGKNKPFLSTMEMFRLKLGTDRTLPDRYAAADEATRRAMLAPDGEVPKTTPSLAAATLWKAPVHITDLEWFATAPDMCRLMADLHRLEQLPGMEPLAHCLRLNPGLQFDSTLWRSVAYKGGSEPGVLNMTWLLERNDGKWFVVSFGWNDPQKDVELKTAADTLGAGVGLLANEARGTTP